MKRILSIGTTYCCNDLDITVVSWEQYLKTDLRNFDAVVVTGGDGSVRRCVSYMHQKQTYIPVLINPTGSFNVIAKQLRISRFRNDTLCNLAKGNFTERTRPYYTLNDQEVFLFSAGNMGDLHHIFIAETLRFGKLKRGWAKYALALLFLLPMHVVLTPFFLASKHRFFIFTPLGFSFRLGSFYSDVEHLKVDLDNDYNYLELDGDIVFFSHAQLHIEKKGNITYIIPDKR